MNTEILFQDTRCLRMRSHRATCERCLSHCPQRAITMAQGPVINHDRCTGCLLCTVACPTGALLHKEAQLFPLLTHRDELEYSVLGCTRPGVVGHFHYPCLGGLPEEIILAFLHLSLELQLNLTGCASCPRGSIVEMLTRRVGKCRAITAPGKAGALRLVMESKHLHFRDRSYSRRDFFRIYRTAFWRGMGEIDRGLRGISHPVRANTKGPPEKRQLLNLVMARLSPDVQQPLLGHFYFELSLRESCDLCFSCGGVCPTGALEISYGNPPALLFRSALCTGCGLCAEICPRGALLLTNASTWEKVNTCRPLVAESAS